MIGTIIDQYITEHADICPFFFTTILAMALPVNARRPLLILSSISGIDISTRQFLMPMWSYSTFAGTFSPPRSKLPNLAHLSCSCWDSPKTNTALSLALYKYLHFLAWLLMISRDLLTLPFNGQADAMVGIPAICHLRPEFSSFRSRGSMNVTYFGRDTNPTWCMSHSIKYHSEKVPAILTLHL